MAKAFPPCGSYDIHLPAGGFLGWNNPENREDGYRLDITVDGTEKRNSLLMMIGSGTLVVLIVFMNFRIALSLYQMRRANLFGKLDREDTRDTESKLFLLTCIMFSFTAITFVNQFLFYFLFLFMSRAVREEVEDHPVCRQSGVKHDSSCFACNFVDSPGAHADMFKAAFENYQRMEK